MMNPQAQDYAGLAPPRWIAYIAVDDADAIASLESSTLAERCLKRHKTCLG